MEGIKNKEERRDEDGQTTKLGSEADDVRMDNGGEGGLVEEVNLEALELITVDLEILAEAGRVTTRVERVTAVLVELD
jgi:hypothetical protein